MPFDTSLDRLYSLVLHQISQAEVLLDELKRGLHHFGPSAFADEIGKKLVDIRKEFLYKLKHGEEEGNKDDVDGICREYLVKLRDINHNAFPLLSPISNIFIPIGLLLPIMNFARKFGDFELSFSPTWMINYELLELGVRTEKPFLFISYPRVEWTNTLLHVLLIHEVFHYVELKEKISDSIGKEIALGKTSLQALVDKAKTRVTEKTEEEIEKLIEEKGVHTHCIDICQKWLREFVCDLLSIRTAGPAYFFALAQFGRVTDTMAKASDTHPPTCVRLKLVLNELKKMDYLTTPHALKEILETWDKKPLADLHFESLLQNVAYECLEKNFNTVANEIQNKFEAFQKSKGLEPYDIDHSKKAEDISQKLRDGIPPIDVWDSGLKKNKPLDMFTIWNAGWLTYIKDMENFYRTVGAISEDEKEKALINFYAIVLKALESSEILRIHQER